MTSLLLRLNLLFFRFGYMIKKLDSFYKYNNFFKYNNFAENYLISFAFKGLQ